MNKMSKEILALAMSVMLLTGCAVQHANYVVAVGSGSKIKIKDQDSGTERIVSLPNTQENKEALRYTLPTDIVNVSGKNYDKDLVMDKAKVVFDADTIYARHQRELFEKANAKYFNGR